MVRQFRLTLREFIDAISRADADQNKYPWLKSRAWLIERATVSDTEVTLTVQPEINARRAGKEQAR